MLFYPKTLKSLLLGVIRIILVLFSVVFILLFVAQERLIFPGTKLPADFQFHFTLPFEEKILLAGGLRLDTLLFRPPNANGLIVYFHGNAGNLASWGEVGEELAERTGMNVWLLDYPGYGKSEGTISSELQLHQICRAFAEAAQQLSKGQHALILYGRSIGTGLAVKLASELQVTGLILESPYFSLKSLVREKFNWAPPFLLRYTLRSDQWFPQIHSPVLILHGDEDEVIPFSQGQRLASLLPATLFVPISGGHHNDLSIYSGYWKAVEPFLSRLNF